MEWKIIIAVLCVIGHAAAQAANGTTEFNITFRISEEFKTEYNNLSAPETVTLMTNITTQLNDVFKTLTGYQNMTIWKFTNGSIVTDGALQFNSSGNNLNATDIQKTLVDKINSGNLTIKIQNDSVKVSPPASANSTTTNSTPANTPTKDYNISFSINEEFKAVYSNLSNPETQALVNNVTTQCDNVFKKLPGYVRMIIRKFSNGSIVTDGALQFNASVDGPNATDIQQTLVAAIQSGNLTISIKNDSIVVTPPATASPNTTNTTLTYNLKFSILQTFNDTLSNLTSPESITFASLVTTECGQFFKKRFSQFLKMIIRKFSKGSIVAESDLQFVNGSSNPTAKDIAQAFLEAAKNKTFSFPVDATSISVTDPNGGTSSGSPVLCSMFASMWMILASLLLTGVMHF